MYNEQRKFVFEQEKLGNVLVLAPRSPLEFHTLDSEPMKIQHIYNLGYEQTIDRIDEIKDFLFILYVANCATLKINYAFYLMKIL